MTGIDAFVLIGGKSSRLGEDKAFVEIRGQSLLEIAASTLTGAFPGSRVTAVVGNDTQFMINPVVSRVPFVVDLYPGRGPLGGLHAALASARTPWVFVLACDYPFMSVELIELISGRCDSEFGAIVPEQADGRMQPLCGLYNVEAALPIAEETISMPRVPPPMHQFVLKLGPRVVRFDEYRHLNNAERLFTNINTPDDLDRARQSAGP